MIVQYVNLKKVRKASLGLFAKFKIERIYSPAVFINNLLLVTFLQVIRTVVNDKYINLDFLLFFLLRVDVLINIIYIHEQEITYAFQ